MTGASSSASTLLPVPPSVLPPLPPSVPPGVIVAGLGLGVAESFAGFLLGAEAQAAFVFSLLVVILVARSLLLHRQRKVLR